MHPGGVLVSAHGGGVDADQGQVHLAPPHGLRDQALQQGLEDAGPASRHCRKQLEAVAQAPNSVGISRHCPPVLNRWITSSNCCRSRSCYGPYAPIGKYDSMNYQYAYASCPCFTQKIRRSRSRREGEPRRLIKTRYTPVLQQGFTV